MLRIAKTASGVSVLLRSNLYKQAGAGGIPDAGVCSAPRRFISIPAEQHDPVRVRSAGVV